MKLKKFRISTDAIVLSAFAMLAASLVWNTTDAILRNYELQQQVDELAAEVEILKLENQNLRFNITYYETDTFLELEAREKFNLAKPGEKLALLERDTEPVRTDNNFTPELSEPKSNFELWLEFLRGDVIGGS